MIEGINLRKVFKSGLFGNKKVVAVDGVSIKIEKGETLGLIGESGSGKSTLGRLLLMLIKPDSGKVIYDGVDITRLKSKELRIYRRKMQLIPQHPYDALDPRWKLYDSIAEPLRIHKLVEDKEEEKSKVLELIEAVNLKEELLDRYPHELSGGELQRAVIARALALQPEFIVCDEPTSMLDISTQASIIRLLLKLQKRYKISYLFITHDLELANVVADKIAVMYKGKIVEEGRAKEILENPKHYYTKKLVEGMVYL
ncbi:MAG TPA: ABC transporter ATP-binding protein [Archaeoglobus profundus]|nr:ABC transporter ATP-binding protein [Archaeoglobus profundus]HIP58659.1 ABC transporter ATP-binding protein [Archaeoglobus profundus]